MHRYCRPFLRPTLAMTFSLLLLFNGLSAPLQVALRTPLVVRAAPLAQVGNTGEPCGRSEQFPSWGVCLHGTLFDQAGAPLDGATVTVTHGDRSLSTISQIYPDEAIPTYAIDIGALEADYLEEVTVSVTANGATLSRKLLVFPDYRTHNQRFDLHLSADNAVADALLWGYVTDFSAHGPVGDAQVTATMNGATTTATTQLISPEPYPIYKFTAQALDAIGATTGMSVTLTAEVDGLRAQGEVTVGTARQQTNFLTGWKCDVAEILPRSGGQFGVPRSGGQFGVPNEGCIWGYGLVDGLPEAGMSILLEVDGEIVGQGVTERFTDEQDPRYAILVQDVDALVGRSLTVTGVYNGITERQTAALTFDDTNSHRVDIAITGIGALEAHVNGDEVNDLMVTSDALWVASGRGGIIRYDLASGNPTHYTTLDGLASNSTKAVVMGGGSFWFATFTDGISRFTPGQGINTDQWQTLTNANLPQGLSSVVMRAAERAPDGTLWFGMGTFRGNAAISRYNPQSEQWQLFTDSNTSGGLLGNSPRSLHVAADGGIWVGSEAGVSHYIPATNSWQTYTSASTNGGLLAGTVWGIADDMNGDLWFGTTNGISRLTPDPATPTWITYTRASTANQLASDRVNAIQATADGQLWFGTALGISRLNPTTGQWTTLTSASTNGKLISNRISVIEQSDDGALWFGTDRGVSRLLPATEQWQSYQLTTTILDNEVRALTEDGNGRLWVGTPSGISRQDGSGQWEALTRATTANGVVNNWVNALARDSFNQIWIGTANGVSVYNPASTNPWRSYKSVDTGGELPNDMITDIAIRADGTIWFGTAAGLSRYAPTSNVWQGFTTATSNLIADEINALAFDQAGDLWIATAAGISYYDPDTDQWASFTGASTGGKLPSDNILAVAVAADGARWFGTDAGAVRYMPGTTQEWQHFSAANTIGGLQSDYVGRITPSPDGSVWFGVVNGVARYTPNGNPLWEQFVPGVVPPNSSILGNYPPPLIFLSDVGVIWFGSEFGLSQESAPPQRSDLTVRFSSDSPSSLLPGETATYHLAISNQGQRNSDTTLVLELPNIVSFVNASLPVVDDFPLTWDLQGLQGAGQQTMLAVTVRVNATTALDRVLLFRATLSSGDGELFLANNEATQETTLRDPAQADLRVSLLGPPFLEPSANVRFTVRVDNIGGPAAENSSLVVTLPPELSSNAPVVSGSPLGTIAFGDPTVEIEIPATVAATVSSGARPEVIATVSTTTPESDTANNQVVAAIPVTGNEITTLILVASQQMARVGAEGATPLLDKLYKLAAHDKVRGLIIDVEQADFRIANAYSAWNKAPADIDKANSVAGEIRKLIHDFHRRYPTLQQLVIVGGDAVIPYYRQRDATQTFWREDRYATFTVPESTVRSALLQNRVLTDDYYTDLEPFIPKSERWPDPTHELFLPDLAGGRLVESAAEISAHIDAFLSRDGVLTLPATIVGGDAQLTNDTTVAQCELLAADGLATDLCTTDLLQMRSAAINQRAGAIWNAQHSNHVSMGEWTAQEIGERSLSYAGTLLFTIGCHAGLNVPLSAGVLPDRDLAQQMLGQGGIFVGSTAYAYASRLKASYSEELALHFTEELLRGNRQSLGPTLVRAKQRYYTEHARWMDAVDEKVLLPMTLYGLPMWEVITPGRLEAEIHAFAPRYATAQPGATGNYLSVPYNDLVDSTNFERRSSGDGSYDIYAGRVLAQEGRPVQPLHTVLVAPLLDDNTPRGLVLRGATYQEERPFDPLIAQSYVVSAEPAITLPEPAFGGTEWDHILPHSLGAFETVTATTPTADGGDQISLNLALGAYLDAEQRYRRFNSLQLELLYSASNDETPAQVDQVRAGRHEGASWLVATGSDDVGIDEVIGICDNGQGSYQSAVMEAVAPGQWWGDCGAIAERVYVQLVDRAGNVADSEWVDATTVGPPPETIDTIQLYLPIVSR